MSDRDGELKTSLRSNVPQQLASELAKMRQNPANFAVGEMFTCKFGCDAVKEGETVRTKSAYQLLNAAGQEAGAWCPIHGWLRFDSVGNPPTERLRPTEVAYNRVVLARKKGPRKERT